MLSDIFFVYLEKGSIKKCLKIKKSLFVDYLRMAEFLKINYQSFVISKITDESGRELKMDGYYANFLKYGFGWNWPGGAKTGVNQSRISDNNIHLLQGGGCSPR
jgi:aconitase B